jgi:hypothetical protein
MGARRELVLDFALDPFLVGSGARAPVQIKASVLIARVVQSFGESVARSTLNWLGVVISCPSLELVDGINPRQILTGSAGLAPMRKLGLL